MAAPKNSNSEAIRLAVAGAVNLNVAAVAVVVEDPSDTQPQISAAQSTTAAINSAKEVGTTTLMQAAAVPRNNRLPEVCKLNVVIRTDGHVSMACENIVNFRWVRQRCLFGQSS